MFALPFLQPRITLFRPSGDPVTKWVPGTVIFPPIQGMSDSTLRNLIPPAVSHSEDTSFTSTEWVTRYKQYAYVVVTRNVVGGPLDHTEGKDEKLVFVARRRGGKQR
eukprot:GHVU01171402.1.p5 GENE.GHVU01171402.1~~GHVU01171402.1.p5  ORF type:complete len:107 (-),score=13.07 GHVU01171402.1:829-1149(-)